MRLNGLDLNQLICLDALITEQNVSRVAEQLHLSQSAVSWTLARLREHFDDPLLIPLGRNMEATLFAKELKEPLRDFMLRAQAVERSRPAQQPRDFDRVIRIVASDATQSICLTKAIKTASEFAPNLRFEILPVTEHSSMDLQRGSIDLLCAGQTIEVDSPGEILYEDDFCCITWSENKVFSRLLTLERYLSMDHVIVKWGAVRAVTNDSRAIVEEGLSRREAVVTSEFASIPELLVGTSRVATIPRRLAEQMIVRWPLKIDTCPLDLDSLQVRAYWRTIIGGDPALGWFRNVLNDTCTDIR